MKAVLPAGVEATWFASPAEARALIADADPLWTAPNCMISMHMSGRSHTRMFRRGAALFLDNLRACVAGRPMRNVAELDAGY